MPTKSYPAYLTSFASVSSLFCPCSITLLYAFFIFEMCIILMNLTIGISISNIQVLNIPAPWNIPSVQLTN